MLTTVDAFLAEHVSSRYTLHALRRGQVNTAWRVDATGQQYFLKYHGDAQHNGIDRQQEIQLQRALYKPQLTPRIIASSSDLRWLLQEWIAAPTLSSLSEQQQTHILAGTLWRIHQQTPTLPRWSLQQRVTQYVSAIPHDSRALAKQQLEGYTDLLQLWDASKAVLCHNDLSADHVLLSNPQRVVDWEYAGYGHAWFDIASCIEINQFSDQAQHDLCRLYSEVSGHSVTVAQLQRWCELVQVINQLWSQAQPLRAVE